MASPTSFVTFKDPEPRDMSSEGGAADRDITLTLTLKHADSLPQPFKEGKRPSPPMTGTKPWSMRTKTFVAERDTQDVLKAIETFLPQPYHKNFQDLYNSQPTGTDLLSSQRFSNEEGLVCKIPLSPTWASREDVISFGGEVIIDVRDFLAQEDRQTARESVPTWDRSAFPAGMAGRDYLSGDEQVRLGLLADIIWDIAKAQKQMKSMKADSADPLFSPRIVKDLRGILERTISSGGCSDGTETLTSLIDAIIEDVNHRRRWWGPTERHNSRMGTEEDEALRLLKETGVVLWDTDKDGLIQSKPDIAGGRGKPRLNWVGRMLVG